MDKTALERWRDMIGHEEADRITKSAGTRGSAIHTLCERLLLNKPIIKKDIMPFNRWLYSQMEEVILEHVDDVVVLEGALYSDKLKIAGTVDLAAEFDNVKSIIDFKSARRKKPIEHIESYFLQTTAYSYMLWERTGLRYEQIVLIIAVEEERKAQVIKADVKDWIKKTADICRRYHDTH